MLELWDIRNYQKYRTYDWNGAKEKEDTDGLVESPKKDDEDESQEDVKA